MASIARSPKAHSTGPGQAAPAGETADDREFGTIFQTYAPYVIGLLRRLGVHAADVQDVAQEVFVAVDQKLPTFEGRSTLKTWICSITARQAANHRKRAYHRRERLDTELSAPQPAVAADQLHSLASKEDREAVLQALDALPVKQRQVFVLYEVEELPMAEVAALLRCPRFTCYTRLRAARKAMRAQLLTMGYGRGEHA